MKKLLLFAISLLIVLTLTQAIAEQDGLYTYEINPDNTVTITGFDWKNNHGDIYIPEMLGNRIVSAIGEKAFMTTENTAVKITLPDSIKSIGEQAFRGVAITYVNIPLNTVEIGGGAFAQCTVSRFNVASGHQVFATIDNALYNKQTKTLIAWPENKEISEIPNGIVNIGDYAFYDRGGWKNLDISLPDSVAYIGKYAFAGCYITTPMKHVSVIDDYAFYKSTVTIESELLLTKIGAHAFEEAGVYLKSYTISYTPYTIGDYAFCKCRFGDRVSIANAYDVGSYAFKNATKGHNESALNTSFTDITNLEEHAFEEANIAQWSSGNGDGWHAYADLTNGLLTDIPAYAFAYTGITDISFSNSISTIGDKAFYGCKELKSVNIPASVTMIGADVFSKCSDLLLVKVEAGTYGEVWARTSGYAYAVNGQEEDTSWLLDSDNISTDKTTIATETVLPTRYSTATPQPRRYSTLYVGDKGTAVRKLQSRLKDLGYYFGDTNGNYDRETKMAVESFQRKNDIKVDGIAGQNTQWVLFEASDVVYAD